MSGPDNINNLPNLSKQIGGVGGARAANKVSGHSAPLEQEKGSQISGNGATVHGSGISEAAAGQAKLGMMAGNNIVSTKGFFKEKIHEKDPVKGEATIETHAAAFLADGPEANGKFQQLMNLASRGAESSSGKVFPHEIELARQAVIPLDGPDAQFKKLLNYAFSLADRQGPITTGAIINSFHEAQE
jgi:hypothetical protein